MGLRFSLCLLRLLFLFVWSAHIKCANFSVDYSGIVYLHSPNNYTYNLAVNKSSVAVRVNLSAVNVTKSYPLIAIFKQQANVLSFTLPLKINTRFSYNTVSRTLCPSFIAFHTFDNSTEQIVVELSSSMPNELHAPFYHLRLDVIHDFVLQIGQQRQLLLTPSEPQYFLFSFPEDIDSVIVSAHSADKLCMTLSVQAAKCPVADILDTVMYSGVFQTVTKLGAITVSKVDQNMSEFLVVLVLKPEDIDCGGVATLIKPENNSFPRVKNVTIIVTPSLAGHHYYLPIYGAVFFYVMFYIAAAVIILVYRSYSKYVQFYFNSFTSLNGHFDRRNPTNISPPPQPTYDSQIMPTIYTHLPVEDAITRARHVVDSNANSTFVAYQRQPPSPPNPLPPHSLFSSSSSSSDLNGFDTDSIHQQLTVRRKSKKLRRPSHIPLLSLQQAKQHRRSLSYGSTRDMGLRGVAVQVVQCSVCARISHGLEGGDVVTSGGKCGVERGLPAVQQVEEGLETSPDLQTSIHPPVNKRQDRHAYVYNRILFVSDLSRKRYSTLNRKYLLYFWYLIIISIFYGLPVVQLVMTYQRALHDTGNEDICYYNFECAHPLGVFTAFNNIISNIGYVMLGLLFLGLTARRDLMHRRGKNVRIHSAKWFCRWLCSRLWCCRNGSNDTATSGGISRQGIVPLPGTPVASSSSSPTITVTRSGSRLLINHICSRFRLTCHGSTQEVLGGHSLNYHQSNDDVDEIERHRETAYGLPLHYGLFYAMGWALTMEGLLSACYHICPSFSNFQFDTAYMHMLALILMLKIYQTRHPDINASAHSAYMVMALVILTGVTGVLYGGETFWVLFAIVFLTMSVWLTAEIYYMGQWNFDICLPRRLYYLIRSDGIRCLTPMYLERMLLLLVANCINIGISVYGLVTRPRDFSSFLLSIFMINLLMYYFFYVLMKCRFRERFHCIPLLYIFLACVTWGSAIYYFIQNSTTWEVTPAQSRALNRPCILLGFYDVHDVWHFLSSTSMFFSFMSIMTLDDDLIDVPRNQIPVF